LQLAKYSQNAVTDAQTSKPKAPIGQIIRRRDDMKVIVCGASRSQDREEVFDALDAHHERETITC
jgi:hypothetical protein